MWIVRVGDDVKVLEEASSLQSIVRQRSTKKSSVAIRHVCVSSIAASKAGHCGEW